MLNADAADSGSGTDLKYFSCCRMVLLRCRCSDNERLQMAELDAALLNTLLQYSPDVNS